MLHIVFGRLPEAVFNTAVYFKNSYEDSWITDDFAKRALRAACRAALSSMSWPDDASICASRMVPSRWSSMRTHAVPVSLRRCAMGGYFLKRLKCAESWRA